MEKEISRVHKLALPLIVKRSGSTLIISDGIFKHTLEIKEFGQLTVRGTDADGFIIFEISKGQQQTLTESFSRFSKSTMIGFSLIGRGTAKTVGGSGTRGAYEYFKRASDEYYYAKHTLGTKTKKIHLGSMQDRSSAIYRIVKGMQTIDRVGWFDRKQLRAVLPPALRHGQKLKSALDILTLEGYLERRESQKKGRPYEQYKTAEKLRQMK